MPPVFPQDLLHLLQQYGSPQRPGGSVYVFIGDCMGAGQHGVEVLLLLLAFKVGRLPPAEPSSPSRIAPM